MTSNFLGGDAETLLNKLLQEHEHYFGKGEKGEKYIQPTTRYEAWLLANVLSNLIIVDELRDLKKIFEGQKVKPIIKRKK